MQPCAHRHVSPLILFQKPQEKDVKEDKVHRWSLAHLFIISKPLTCYNMSRQSSPTSSLLKAAGSFTRCPRSGKQSLPAHEWPRYTGPLALVTEALRAITNVCIESLKLFSTELARSESASSRMWDCRLVEDIRVTWDLLNIDEREARGATESTKHWCVGFRWLPFVPCHCQVQRKGKELI